MIQDTRIQPLNDREIGRRSFVLYWMQFDMKAYMRAVQALVAAERSDA